MRLPKWLPAGIKASHTRRVVQRNGAGVDLKHLGDLDDTICVVGVHRQIRKVSAKQKKKNSRSGRTCCKSLIHPSMEMKDVHVLYASTLALGFDTEHSLPLASPQTCRRYEHAG